MKIIGISGRKQAGKNTVANYINGEVLQRKKMINSFYIDENGSLLVNTEDATGHSGYGILDITRKDSIFVEYAEKELWPYIKVYHFADPLKEIAISLFDVESEKVYGSDDDKNSFTNIKWEDVSDGNKNTGYLTIREFLEHFGTKVIRRMKANVWSDYSIKKILSEQSEIAIIPDVRFPNEVAAIQNAGGVVIRLTRNTFNSTAEPEVALDQNRFDWGKFDLVIDNECVSLDELCNLLKTNNRIWS
jgi:hypothetical protein